MGSGHEKAAGAAGDGERSSSGGRGWRRWRGLGSRDGSTTLTAKIAASTAAFGQQYKRTSLHRPWRSHRRGLTLTGCREDGNAFACEQKHQHRPVIFGPTSLVGGGLTSERQRVAAQVFQPGYRSALGDTK